MQLKMLKKNKVRNLVLKYSPGFLLDLYCSWEGLKRYRMRYGYLFDEYYDFYSRAALWPESKLIAYQNERLKELIEYCYQSVPYYKKLFDQIGIKPSDIVKIEDLKKLPFLDKIKVREIGVELVSRKFDVNKLPKGHTSGSTGTPLTLYYSPEMWSIRYAFLWARQRAGVRRGQKHASFHGYWLAEPGSKTPPFWRTNYIAKQRLYSVFHLHNENLKYYVEDMNSFRPEYIQGYPSAMYILAEYMKRKGLSFAHPLKAAFSANEVLQDIHKEMITEVWRCPVWDSYGLGERVAIITLYECGNYHYDMDFGIIEFIPVGNDKDGEIAEIVGTGFINRAWPLIRYRTGDLVLLDRTAKCHCGRPGPVIKSIIGRTGDIITTPDGRKVMNVTAAVRDVHGLSAFQVVHNKLDEITINVVRSPDYDSNSEDEILARLGDIFGPSVNLKINYVDEIERTKAGKFKVVVSKV